MTKNAIKSVKHLLENEGRTKKSRADATNNSNQNRFASLNQ